MIVDDKYVIQQACCLDVLVRQNSKIGIDVIHEVLKEALLRIVTAESNNECIDQAVKIKIINDLTYLRTYLKLSQHLRLKNVSSSRFVERFLPINLLGLAKSFAVHGDIRSVCLLVSRHYEFWECITTMIEVINCLPLSFPIRDFEMLLPDTTNTNAKQWWSKTIEFVENYLLMQVFEDASEKRHIESTINTNRDNCYRDGVSFIAWYLERARLMVSSFGLLDSTVLFLNRAMETVEEEILDRNENMVVEIMSLRANLYHIHSIVELGMHVLVQRIQSMSVHEFESLGISGAIELILGGCKDEKEFTFRYREILHPMFSPDDVGPDYVIKCWPDLITGQPCYNYDRRQELQLGLVLFCLSNLQNAVDSDIFNNCGCSQGTLTALTLCEVIAKGSCTEILPEERLIGDTLTLMQFVLDVAKTVAINLRSHHIEVLWRLYECIPENLYSKIDVDGWKCLSQSLDSLYRALLGLDVCQRWLYGDVRAPVALDELHDAHLNNPNLDVSACSLAGLGAKLVVSMCGGFTKKCKELSGTDTDILFLCFVSDISDLNDYCCKGLLHVEDAFNMHLILPLLEASSFEMLRKFLLTGWVSKRLVFSAVEKFASDITSNTHDDC
eukprot:CAMPEP_0176484750 /NCGR_PEP_ID=MMETSP0200_2-20121128/4624_1 /TAXON_ID=947934 /ORGANISM="Chaetoceros sp., Strain GSL56" /LENGTH=613 /DNA_ID=CAMNT_0017881251 /DNA_START=561 /DNA_END=2402 /DNA_ORIENTATION=+